MSNHHLDGVNWELQGDNIFPFFQIYIFYIFLPKKNYG